MANKKINFGQEVVDFAGNVVMKNTANGPSPMHLSDIAYYVLSAVKPTKDTALIWFNIGKKITSAEVTLSTNEVKELISVLDQALENEKLSMLEYGLLLEALN
jgi:hypothetical protein